MSDPVHNEATVQPPATPPAKRRLRRREAYILAGVAGAALVLGAAAAPAFTGAGPRGLTQKVQAHFPNTKITSVRCGRDSLPSNVCEVVAGANVFYTSKDGRLAFVGSVLDLDEKVDLTDKRLRELAAVQSATDKLDGGGAPTAPGPGPVAAAAPSAAPQGAPAAPRAGGGQVVKVSLPRENAIVHNPGGAMKMTVFTDLNCSYCNKLMTDLRGVKDIEVTEYPIGILGPESDQKAKMVLCATDRVAAAEAAYFGGEIKTSGDCADAERRVRENSHFASQNGISGTPAIIRGDGVMNGGWLPPAELRAFLGQSGQG